MNGLEIKVLENSCNFAEIENVQRSAWGLDDANVVPSHLLEAMGKYGAGLIIGAYLDCVMVGFMLILETRDKAIHYLHMIGVSKEHQGGCGDLHVGEELFRFYGNETTLRGVKEVLWTFDPLLGVNASLYFHKLGAQAVCYIKDAYSTPGKSGIYCGLPMDRLLVSWRTNTFRTISVSRESCSLVSISQEFDGAPFVALEIPVDINELKIQNLPLARRVRETSGSVFIEAMSRGYKVADFLYEKERQRSFYIFQRGRQ